MSAKKYFKKSNDAKGMEIEDSILTATEPEAAKVEILLEKKGLDFFWIILMLVFFVIFGRVFYLNVMRGGHYREVSEGNRIRAVSIKAPRGKIYDRFRNILVNNVPSVDAVIIPADLPRESAKRKEIALKLSEILKINEGELFGMMENLDFKTLSPILIRENISRDETLILIEKERELPGIKIEKTSVRDYVSSTIFSHILGYEGKIKKEELEKNPDYLMTDYIGKQGIEKSYEKYLRGRYGSLQVEVDSLGNVKREIGSISPEPGSDLVLSIDAELQKHVFDELSNVLEKTKTRTAAAVAINPQNGEVLALVSIPSYDNNLFVQGISAEEYSKIISDPDKPLFNRVALGEYPPGSTVKPLLAVAALEEKTINEHTSVSDPGSISIGSYSFRDWKAHGTADVRKAIAESCDVFFYSVGGGYNGIEGLGMSRMKKYYNLFGLGEKTGIDLSSESDGFIPDEKWKEENMGERWFIGNSFHAAIGQGYITATPLQLANYIAAVANGGRLYKPRIVSFVSQNEREDIPFEAEVIRDKIASKESIKIAQEGMRQTVVSGTAQSLSDLPVAAAGKTGTAQFGAENKTHAWFVSYAPYENPKIAMAILVEGGGEGHSSAVPATNEIYRWYFGDRK